MLIDVPDTPGLSWMERSVQGLVAMGLRTSEIAKMMGLSPDYVTHLRAFVRRSLLAETVAGSGKQLPAAENSRRQRKTVAGSGKPLPATGPPLGTVSATRANSDLSSNSSSPDPTPISLPSSGSNTTSDTTQQPMKRKRPASDPLISAVKAAFVSQYPEQRPDWNWPAQMRHIKALVARARKLPDPEEHLRRVLEAFAWLTLRSQDKFWRQQPFSPMTLSSEAIYTRVCRYMEGEKSVVDETLREMGL